MQTEHQILESSDYGILSDYVENIYINDMSRTQDETKIERYFTHYRNLSVRTEIFNNFKDQKFQIIFPDNFRAIYAYFEGEEKERQFNTESSYSANIQKNWTHQFENIENTQFSNTGYNRDFTGNSASDVKSQFPRNTILVRKHYLIPQAFIYEMAEAFQEKEFIESLSQYAETKRNIDSEKHHLYGLIWRLCENKGASIGSIIDLIKNRNTLDLHLIHEFRIDESSLYGSLKYKGMYFEPANIVISRDLRSILNHPFSTRDLLLQRRRSLINNFQGFHFSIEIVDNSGRYESRFLPFGKEIDKDGKETVKVNEIIPISDPLRKDGVYVFTVKNINGRALKDENVYTMDEAQAIFNLYATREKAQTHGNVSGAIERELEELRRKNAYAKEELETKKHEFSRKELEISSENTRLKQEARERELEIEILRHDLEKEKLRRTDSYDEKSTIRKDHYEERSHDRKDNSEIVKYLPSLLVGIIGITIAIFKFF